MGKNSPVLFYVKISNFDTKIITKKLVDNLTRVLASCFWIIVIFAFDSVSMAILTIICAIIHEAGHIKNAIWRYIGYTPMRDNDEVDQYLVTYIYNKIVDVFYKHNNIKDNLMRDV